MPQLGFDTYSCRMSNFTILDSAKLTAYSLLEASYITEVKPNRIALTHISKKPRGLNVLQLEHLPLWHVQHDWADFF